MLHSVAVEDVRREVKIFQALTGHENVVQFHNAFEDDSYVFIVMEYAFSCQYFIKKVIKSVMV